MDCHVETYRDARSEGHHRAYAVHTATGRVLYVTWPYRDENAAHRAAWKWLRNQYAKADAVGRNQPLFSRELTG